MDEQAAETYRRVKIAMLTGWTLEYIDALGCEDETAILEIHEAEQALKGR